MLAGQEEQDAKSIRLQEKLVTSEQDRANVIQEKQKLYESFGEFREKYAKLVDQKNEIQAELIKTEENRMKVSQLLVETQIEVIEPLLV